MFYHVIKLEVSDAFNKKHNNMFSAGPYFVAKFNEATVATTHVTNKQEDSMKIYSFRTAINIRHDIMNYYRTMNGLDGITVTIDKINMNV